MKRDGRLNASFVNRGDMMQMPMNRKMLNEVGVEHQGRRKTDIENECVSTRSILSSKRRCLKDMKLGMGTQLLQYKSSNSFSAGSFKVRKADLLLMEYRPGTLF